MKSGKDVIDEFFAEILNIESVEQKTAKKLVKLYKENKLTDSNIQNALEELKQEELNSKAKDDDKN